MFWQHHYAANDILCQREVNSSIVINVFHGYIAVLFMDII